LTSATQPITQKGKVLKMPTTTHSLESKAAQSKLITPAIRKLIHHGLRSNTANMELGAILRAMDCLLLKTLKRPLKTAASYPQAEACPL
jgi:hypothetical protein